MVRKCYNEDQVEWSLVKFAHPDLTIAYSAIGGMVGISNPSRLNLIRAFPQKLTIGVLTFGD